MIEWGETGRRSHRAPRAAALVLALASVWAASSVTMAESVVVGEGKSTRYLANLVDPGFGTSWKEPTFVEGPEWSDGTFGLGYENTPPGAQALIQTTVATNAKSVYSRTTFNLANADGVYSVFLGADYDDGIVAWLNGVEIYRSPEVRNHPLTWNGTPGSHESSNGAEPDYTPMRNVSTAALDALQDGTNLLAIAVWNTGGSDLVLAPQLVLNRMLTRAPYLQKQTDTSVVIRWTTALPSLSRVRYGPAPDQLDQNLLLGPVTVDHVVELEQLEPATRYYYSVGAAGEALAGGDTEHYFETPPPAGVPKPTRVWVLGDSGWGNVAARKVRDAYYGLTGDAHTDLWLMLGDNAYPTSAPFQEFQHEALRHLSGDAAASRCSGPTIGNHDLFDRHDADLAPLRAASRCPTQAEAGGVASGTEALLLLRLRQHPLRRAGLAELRAGCLRRRRWGHLARGWTWRRRTRTGSSPTGTIRPTARAATTPIPRDR